MKRNEAQLHSERARIAEDLEEAHERLAAEVAAQVRNPRVMVGFGSVRRTWRRRTSAWPPRWPRRRAAPGLW